MKRGQQSWWSQQSPAETPADPQVEHPPTDEWNELMIGFGTMNNHVFWGRIGHDSIIFLITVRIVFILLCKSREDGS